MKYHFKFFLKKIFKLAFYSILIAFVFNMSSSYVGKYNVDGQPLAYKGKFQSDVTNFAFSVPKKIANFLVPIEGRKTVPKEVRMVYEDLENRLNDSKVELEQKDEDWRLSKVKETAKKFNLTEKKVMELYVIIKKK